MKKRFLPYIVACALSVLFTACEEPVAPDSFDFIGKWAFEEYKGWQLVNFPYVEARCIPVYITLKDSDVAILECYDIDGFNTQTRETYWRYYYFDYGDVWLNLDGKSGSVYFPNKNTILLQTYYENNDTTPENLNYIIKLRRVK